MSYNDKTIAFYAANDDGTFDELIVDVYNRHYTLTYDLNERYLWKSHDNKAKEFFEHIDCHEINPPCKLDDNSGNFGNLTKISYSLANFFTDLSKDFSNIRKMLNTFSEHFQKFI